jgi:hypothetical protein
MQTYFFPGFFFPSTRKYSRKSVTDVPGIYLRQKYCCDVRQAFPNGNRSMLLKFLALHGQIEDGQVYCDISSDYLVGEYL